MRSRAAGSTAPRSRSTAGRGRCAWGCSITSAGTGSHLAARRPAGDQARQRGRRHLRPAGGVAWRDTLEAPVFDQALALIDEEGVHAIVGPGTSSDALDIGRAIGAARGIPLVTPSATSPAVAAIDDRGYVFRSIISDVAQGPILARLAADEGYGHVAVAYRDDAWGAGLAESFFAAWDGRADRVKLDPEDDSYIDELRGLAGGGAPVLIAIAFTGQAIQVVGDALAGGTFDAFIFSDGSRSPRCSTPSRKRSRARWARPSTARTSPRRRGIGSATTSPSTASWKRCPTCARPTTRPSR